MDGWMCEYFDAAEMLRDKIDITEIIRDQKRRRTWAGDFRLIAARVLAQAIGGSAPPRTKAKNFQSEPPSHSYEEKGTQCSSFTKDVSGTNQSTAPTPCAHGRVFEEHG